jgi:hypothetical protein
MSLPHILQALRLLKSQPSFELQARVLAARETNPMEDLGRELETAENTVQFVLRLFEIRTCLLRLGPPGD